jgi:hypothetical protein
MARAVQPKLNVRTIFLSVCKVKQKLILLSYGSGVGK